MLRLFKKTIYYYSLTWLVVYFANNRYILKQSIFNREVIDSYKSVDTQTISLF